MVTDSNSNEAVWKCCQFPLHRFACFFRTRSEKPLLLSVYVRGSKIAHNVANCVTCRGLHTFAWSIMSIRRWSNIMYSPNHTGLTTRLRPSCNRNMLETWPNRRKNARLVAEALSDRQGKISRKRSMVMFKTSIPRFQIVSGCR